MSTRRLPTSAGEAHFDHGAQYFTVHNEAFRRRVDGWVAEGVVAQWPSAGKEAAGKVAYVGVPAMNAPIRQMADGQKVLWATQVVRIENHGRDWRLFADRGDAIDVDVALIALPAEQASVLLAPVSPDLAARAGAVRTEPCWTVMLAFPEPVAVAQDCWMGKEVIGWAARNNSKPGRIGLESWVVQASAEWSALHLEADRDWVVAALKEALSELLGVQLPLSVGESGHRWRFARSGAEGAGAIWDQDRRLGLCGDWLIGPRVEAAWLSGTALAEQISGKKRA